MADEADVRRNLEEVLVPGVNRSVVALNLVRGIEIEGDRARVTMASAALDDDAQDKVRVWSRAAVEKTGIRTVDVDFVETRPLDVNQVKHVITVMSGKGGVGKSLVTGLTAVALRRLGHDVGILDADITGSSIPRMFGVTARPTGSEAGILPVPTRGGIEVMSMNLLLPQEESAVIWRGPLLTRAISQFWEDVLWGNLDFLVVDLPPGTGDAPLSALQTLPVSGLVIVFTPQDLTTMIVRKAVDMARKMEKTVLGVVENMSYLYVPEIDKRIELFGKSKGQVMAEVVDAPLLGTIPIDPELARLCDEGRVEEYASTVADDLGEALLGALAERVATS
jgi:hydrogenase maturation protease